MQLSKISFEYSEKDEPADYVSNIAVDMQQFRSPSQYLVGSRLFKVYEEDKHRNHGDTKRGHSVKKGASGQSIVELMGGTPVDSRREVTSMLAKLEPATCRVRVCAVFADVRT